MAQPTKQQTEDLLLEVGKWTEGVVNARPGKDISKNALQDAVNVDISDAGTIRRRKGYRLEVGVSTKGSSCFADDYGLYFKDGPVLKKCTLNNGLWTVGILRSDLDASSSLFWTSAQGNSWYSNGIQSGRIVHGSHAYFSLEIPAGQPTLSSSTTGGSLPPGSYGVAVSFISSSGEESGTQIRVQVEVGSAGVLTDSYPSKGKPPNKPLNPVPKTTGKIIVTNIPQPSTADVAFIRLYVTEADGTVPYKYADLPVGTYMFLVGGSKTKGSPLVNELTDKFPPCTLIQAWRGYMLGADENVLWYSEPQRFGLCQLQENFIQFSAPIKMIAPVDDGFYVSADRTYFISGGTPKDWTRREVLPYGGAVPGTYFKHPTKVQCGWFTDRGEIIGKMGGELRNETLDKIAPRKYSKGASLYRREDGIEQIVNVFPEGGDVQVMGASSFTDAEIIRAKVS